MLIQLFDHFLVAFFIGCRQENDRGYARECMEVFVSYYFKIGLIGFLYFMVIAPLLPSAWCSDKTAQTVEKSVETSIHTRQKSQQELDQWQQEREALLFSYETLLQEQEFLRTGNEVLKEELTRRREAVDALKKQQQENEKLTREILPFLQTVYGELNGFVKGDLPFLEEERRQRMERLSRVMNDPDATIAEQYRKVMEALFVEAEYGNTIEVTRDKIIIDGSDVEVMADIIRIGRVSLFSLALDQGSAAYFNVVDNRWIPLNSEHVRSIHGAVEIGKKQRTVEILSMPLGRLQRQ